MTTGQLKVHSENILPIIKRWLYSDKDIFVRELVSNACDAIGKLKFLSQENPSLKADANFQIDIAINTEKKTLTFKDNGIGMTAEEVEKYIADVAFSGAEDFVKKYKDKGSSEEQFIGHFGLGFYSAYMVAEKVRIHTLSAQPGSQPAVWECDGSSSYELSEGDRKDSGTEITLFVSEDEKEFLEEPRLKEVLDRYCKFLPYPVFLNGKQINEKEPLWIKNASDLSDSDYQDFFSYLYPFEDKPLFWIHLNVDVPFKLKGILFFSKIKQDFVANPKNIHLYCNRVFVTDNCKDILPDFLTPLKGIIDSPDIPLNVSRSHLQVDRTVRQVSTHIGKKVADKLKSFFTTDKSKFIECWEQVEVVLKLGALQDEKFYERIKDLLIWKTTQGEWLTAEEYLTRNGEKTGEKIFYIEKGSQSQLIKLYEEKGIEVLYANPLLDKHLIHHVEQKEGKGKFKRIDSHIEEALVEKEEHPEGSALASVFKELINEETLEVKAQSLANTEVPVLVTMDEEMRRMRDMMRQSNPGEAFDAFPAKKTLIINTNNPIIKLAGSLREKDEELTKSLVKELYDLALLSQEELNKNELNAFVTRTTQLIQTLTNKIAQS